MVRYPEPTGGLDTATSFFTMLKWVFVYGSFVLLLVGVGLVLIQWVRGRMSK